VKFYKAEKGWGAISVVDLPPGTDVWVHYSVIEGTGYRELAAGDEVELELEAAQQDGFRHRATRVRRLGPGPAPTLRRRGDEVRVEPEGTPDTPLLPRSGRPAP
jgi:cold shock protein